MLPANRNVQTFFTRVPVATLSIWSLVTAWFSGRQCDQPAVIGLSFIAALLSLFLWARASISVYNARKQRRTECCTWLWKLLALAESSTVVLLFLTVVLTTPPGSTCLLPSANGTAVQQTTLSYMLAIATLGALIAPQLLEWMLTTCEALGIQARGERSVPVTDPGFSAHRGDHWLVHGYAGARAMLHSDRLQRLLWQLLPTTAIPLYKVATAGQANAATTMCTSDERSWLLALIAVCGAVSLFLNLESYERHWDEPEDVADDPTRSLYRKRWLYNVWAIMQSAFTTAMFVGVAILTPPAGPCLFPSTRNNSLLQNLSLMILLPMAGVALALVMLRAYLARGGRSDEELELSRALSGGSRVPSSKAGAVISGYAITAAAAREDLHGNDLGRNESFLPVV